MTKKLTPKQRTVVCMLLLSYLVVANIGYNFWTAEKGTPIWKSLTANVIYDLWKAHRKATRQYGMVLGILFNRDNPSVLIGCDIVREGDEIDGVKVVKINKKEVQFEKNGQMWTQQVQQRASSAWKG